MKNVKNKKVICVASITILVLSLAFLLVDVLVPLRLWTHSILNFLFCLLLGFGILLLSLGFKSKSAWYVFLGTIFLGFAIFYVLMQYLYWWLALVIMFVCWAVFGVLSFMRSNSKTEYALNDEPEYKDYKQRTAEKVEVEKVEELPKIKSFK